MAWDHKLACWVSNFPEKWWVNLKFLQWTQVTVTEVWIVTVKLEKCSVRVLEDGSSFLSWRGQYGILHLARNEKAAQLCFLNLHPPVSYHSSPQLTLPEGTQPRWGHTLTCCRMGESRTHVTTFGGGSKYYVGIKDSDIPKLADTTVLEFGEQNTFHCTIYWVVCSLTLSYCVNQLNRSLIDIHLGPTDCGSASCFLVCVTYLQLLTCNLHCYNVYWLCIRGWLIQLLYHFISLIPRPFSCPALISCGVTDWMAWKLLSNAGVYNNCPLMVFYVCGSHC